MDQNRGLWIGVAVVIVLILLGLWWMSSSQPQTPTGGQTGTTTGTQTGGGGMTTGSNFVTTERRSSSNVADIVGSISGTSAFASLFASTGVRATIQGVGPYTIFVPTDGAFSLLPSGTIANMSAEEKKRLVQHHVISGKAIDPDAIQTGQVQALSKDMLNFEVSSTDRTARVNSAFFIKAYQGRNGVVYLISSVLLPPAPNPANTPR